MPRNAKAMSSRVPTKWSQIAIVSPSLTWQSAHFGRTPVAVFQCAESWNSSATVAVMTWQVWAQNWSVEK